MWHRGLWEAIQRANNMDSDPIKHRVTPPPPPTPTEPSITSHQLRGNGTSCDVTLIRSAIIAVHVTGRTLLGSVRIFLLLHTGGS